MLKLTIETDNAAFGEVDENGNISRECQVEINTMLCAVGRRVTYGEESGDIRDYNGNKVGEFSFE